MQFDLRGMEGRSVVAKFERDGEYLVCLRNAMIAKSSPVVVERFSQSVGSYFYRALGGAQSLLISFRGEPNNYVVLGPPRQGCVRVLQPQDSIYVIQSSLLFFEGGLNYEFSNPGVSSMLAGYGVSQVVFSGQGAVGVMGNNFIDEISLENEDLFVDSKHVLAWERSLEFKVETIKSKGMFSGAASGDLLGAAFKGTGKLWIQSSAE